MFEDFSRAYYLGRLYVEPESRETARMCTGQYERLREQLYGDRDVGESDPPLVVKLASWHLAVRGGAGVPADTLSVPDDILDETRIRNPPALTEVWLAKADRAGQLLRFTGPSDSSAIDADSAGI